MTRQRLRRSAQVLAAVVGVTLLGACGDGDEGPTGAGSGTPTEEHDHDHGGAGEPAFDRAAADTGVDVTLRDYAFEGIAATVKGPKVFFQARNVGPAEHELDVLYEDGREAGAIPPFAKGGTRSLAVELRPGTYRVQCLVREGARTHAELGMQTEFIVE